MTAHIAIFRDQIYERIEAAATLRWQRLSDYDKDPVPTREALRHLFESAFFASFRAEEGAAVSFRLTYSTPERLENRERRWPSIATVKFAASYPLSVSELVKLAHCHDPRTSTLAITPDADGLRIAGLFQFGPIRAPLVESGGNVPPMGFSILARSPGRLAISVGPWLIGRFEDGMFFDPHPGDLGPHTELGETIHRTALAHTWHEPNRADKNAYASTYLRSFEELLYDMANRGHGGTVLWVPKANLNTAKSHLRLRREISRSSAAGVDHICQLVTSPGGDVRHQMLSRLRQFIAMLAQFTAVDGALLIDDFLQPIGFSAEILAPPCSAPVINMSDPARGHIDLTNFGMRHNSAVRFASAVTGSVVLVLSADGPARGIMAAGNTVLWWPDLTTSVFA